MSSSPPPPPPPPPPRNPGSQAHTPCGRGRGPRDHGNRKTKGEKKEEGEEKKNTLPTGPQDDYLLLSVFHFTFHFVFYFYFILGVNV